MIGFCGEKGDGSKAEFGKSLVGVGRRREEPD